MPGDGGTCLPETDNDKYRRFGVEVVFVGADGKNDIHYTNFSPDILDWQFLGDVYVAKQDYTSIKVSYTYCRNANLAFLMDFPCTGGIWTELHL